MGKVIKRIDIRYLFLISVTLFFMSIIFVIFPYTAAAHPPSDVTLVYDKATKTLSVTITHTVSDPKSHYIKTVIVMSNGTVVQSTTYDSQPTADTFTYKYTLEATAGTELSARAECSFFGSDTGTVTVP